MASPGGGAAVMGTGIVSIGLALDHQLTLSRALFAVAVALWLIVVAAFLLRRDREKAHTAEVLTLVAATGVLGARVTVLGQAWAGYLLLVVAVCFWIGLVPSVLRHWSTPTVGISFLLTVATETLAVLGAALAVEDRVGWLAACALVPLVLGLLAYVYTLARVDLRQLLTGRGDHWIFGGALAIATLACAQVAEKLHGAFDVLSLVLWAAAVSWLPPLLAGELISPRLRHDVRRWSTVFPVGMYAVATIATGNVMGIRGLAHAGRVSVWPAFALWAITSAASVRSRLRVAREA